MEQHGSVYLVNAFEHGMLEFAYTPDRTIYQMDENGEWKPAK